MVTRAASPTRSQTRNPDDVRYEALLARDPRFDGVFFVAVTTTGIYCRPICPVRTPMRSRCVFFETAAQAERAGFRACFRCRPELAPAASRDGRAIEGASFDTRVSRSTRVSVDAIDTLVTAATQRIHEGALNDGTLDELARELGVTARHLRRALEARLGVSPVELAQSRRLALAKQLLQDTLVPATDIAFAAGFGSVRRFNAVFAARMGRPPSEVRRVAVKPARDSMTAAKPARDKAIAANRTSRITAGDTMSAARRSASDAKTRSGVGDAKTGSGAGDAKIGFDAKGRVDADDAAMAGAPTLRLDYREPYDWPRILGFLRGRAIPGVEIVGDGFYRRVVHLGGHVGEIRVEAVRHASARGNSVRARPALQLTVSPSLLPVLMQLVARVRRMFDLDAHPDRIEAVLRRDRTLARHLAKRPGLRVPGAIDPFEAAIRALLGQQVSVAAATTLAGRFAAQLGAPIKRSASDSVSGSSSDSMTASRGLAYRFPTPAEVVAAGAERIAKLGMPGKRGLAIHTFARAIVDGTIRLDTTSDLDTFVDKLVALPGIGPWTAHYLAMRALHLPDAFPAADLGVQKALGMAGAKAAEQRAEAWRPYRSYAVLHLWTGLGDET
ncbi:MAG TPA: AlkA N-terminal domain-containing protein [Kofleriaceae bacterium]|nr:AlkA N-terminal domain-containing protein [Kofleriaceae bacterium]